MATAYQTAQDGGGGGGGGGASKKKKSSTRSSAHTSATNSPTVPASSLSLPTLSFPKIGAGNGGGNGAGGKNESGIHFGAGMITTAVPSSSFPGDFSSALPKLDGGKNSHASSQANTRRQMRLSNADEHPPSSLANAAGGGTSLPSVSPRIDTTAALQTKILANLDSARSNHSEETAVTVRRSEPKESGGGAKESKRSSTKKKAKREKAQSKKDKENHLRESHASVVNRQAAATANAAEDDDEYEYDDDEYSSPSHSRPGTGSNPHQPAVDGSVATVPTATSSAAVDAASSPAIDTTSPLPVKRKVGPAVAFASAPSSSDLDTSVTEELDNSFHAPTKTPYKVRAPQHHQQDEDEEVEEEAGANLFSSSSLLSQSITDELASSAAVESMSAGEESITALLASSPQGGEKRTHPTSLTNVAAPTTSASSAAALATTLKSPSRSSSHASGGAKSKAGASKKKALAPSLKNKQASSAAAAAAVAQSSSHKKRVGLSTPAQFATKPASSLTTAAPPAVAKAVVVPPTPIVEDNYAEEDWRNATMNFSAAGSTLQRQLEDAVSNATGGQSTRENDDADSTMMMPDEMIRFTMRDSTLQELYAQHSIPATQQSHTTLEFSRSQRLRLTANGQQVVDESGREGELQGETKWMPIYSTKLSSSALPPSSSSSSSSTAVPPRRVDPSVFTVDRSTFGQDPNESLLVQLWNNVYNEDASAAEEPSNTSTSSTANGNSPGSSFSRTLLAEFQTSLKDFTQYSSSLLFDRTQHLKTGGAGGGVVHHQPNHTAVAPRSALKAPNTSHHGDLSSPSGAGGGGGGGVKHHVRFFEKVEVFRLSARLDQTTVLTEEKSVSPPVDTASSSLTPEDLAGLFMTDQAWTRRGRMSAGKVNPAAVAATNAAATGNKSSTKKKSTATAASHPAPSPPPSSTLLRLQARASSLPKMDFHSSGPNSILEFHVFTGGTWSAQPLWRSECVWAATEPTWKPFVMCLPASDSPAGMELLDAPMLLKLVHFVDHSVRAASTAANGTAGAAAAGEKHAAQKNDSDTIGQCLTSLRALLPFTTTTSDASASIAPPPLQFVLTHPARQKLSSKAACGKLTLHYLPLTPATGAGSRRASGNGSALTEKDGVKQTTGAAGARRKSNSRPGSKH